jgi:hypothetical protein
MRILPHQREGQFIGLRFADHCCTRRKQLLDDGRRFFGCN